MGKATKIWLIIATFLVVIGLGMFAAVMAQCRWDFTKLNTVKYENNTHQVSEEFYDISVQTDTADILLVPAEDGICRVVCHEQENARHSVSVQDGTLTIEVVYEKEWYEYIGVSFGAPKITVYLPDSEYGAISVKESTGDIHVENVSVDTLELSVSTGDVKLTDVVCRRFTSGGSTGDVDLKNVIATETLSIERSTGDVRFDGCDADEIFVKTDTGDVTGTLLSEKVFITETDTGDVDVPQKATGGKCEISTDTGDIKIDIP